MHVVPRSLALASVLVGSAFAQTAPPAAERARTDTPDLARAERAAEPACRVNAASSSSSPASAAWLARAAGASVSQQAKLTLRTPTGTDFLGDAVSLDGDRALVGADGVGFNRGAAYLYTFDATRPPGRQWRRETILTLAGAEVGDRFGRAVSLDGDRALIAGGGSTYVYEHDGVRWNRRAILTADDGTTPSSSVSLDGDRALVSGIGFTYVFAYDGTRWREQATLAATDGTALGGPVSLDGDRALVRTSGDAGRAAFVFAFDGAGWTQQGKLLPDDYDADEALFGASVALSGDHALVGAPFDQEVGTRAGAAFVFSFDEALPAGQQWREQTKILPPPNVDAFAYAGRSVSLGGDHALLGAPTDDDPCLSSTGSAYLYAFDGATWTLVTEVTASDKAKGDEFGDSVSLSESRALIGAPKDGPGNVGAAYVFDLSSDEDAAPADAEASTRLSGAELTVSPNPTAGRTTVAFTIKAATTGRLTVVDVLGREVAVLADGALPPGRFEAEFSASTLAAGAYLVRLRTSDGRVTAERLIRSR